MLLIITAGTRLSRTANTRHSRAQKRRKPPSPKPEIERAGGGSSRAQKEVLALVRAGTEKFILENATVEDFFKTIRAVSEKEKMYSHQLTRAVFTRIVREAIQERRRRKSQ